MPTHDTLSPHDHAPRHEYVEREGNDMAMFGVDALPAQGRYAYDARRFESMTLSDGEVVRMPSASAAALEEPLHMAVTGTPEKTTGYTRLVMAGAMFRHFVRGIGDAAVGFDGGTAILNATGLGLLVDWFSKGREQNIQLIEELFANASKNRVSVDDLVHQEDFQKLVQVVKSAGMVKDPVQTLKDTYQAFLNIPENITGNDYITRSEATYQKFKDGVNAELKKNQFGHVFDAGLGAIISLLTVKYALDVKGDMHRGFAEAVAYEDSNYDIRKKPSEVNLGDLFHSDNKIVQETCQNYVSKNAVRGAVCAAFFGRFAAKAFGAELAHMPFGDLMLGGMGLLMLTEVMRKDSSIFNDVIDLVDNKLNPRRGMAAPINGSDLWDLCQKDFLNRHPEKMFKDATHNNHSDGGKWESARAICDRMAEMMNHTYKYKNPNVPMDDPVAQVEQEIIGRLEYFTLPKFIYLQGHDMIDFNRPDLTLACAEIANTYSVQAAKRFWHLVNDEHVSLKDALGDYVVDLSRTLGGGDPEIDEISARAPLYRKAMIENFLQDNVTIHDKYDMLQAIKEQMQQQGNTVILRDEANAIIKEIRLLMDERKQHVDGELKSRAESPPATSVNSIVPHARMVAPNTSLAPSFI